MVGLTVGSNVGNFVGVVDGGKLKLMVGVWVGFGVGCVLGITVGGQDGDLVGVCDGTVMTSSFNVKLDITLTMEKEVAQAPRIVIDPEPAAGNINVAWLLAILLPLQPPPENVPADVSKTYCPKVLDMCTVRVSPGT